MHYKVVENQIFADLTVQISRQWDCALKEFCNRSQDIECNLELEARIQSTVQSHPKPWHRVQSWIGDQTQDHCLVTPYLMKYTVHIYPHFIHLLGNWLCLYPPDHSESSISNWFVCIRSWGRWTRRVSRWCRARRSTGWCQHRVALMWSIASRYDRPHDCSRFWWQTVALGTWWQVTPVTNKCHDLVGARRWYR